MNWEMVGAIAELAGAFAVVLSLAYLGRQVRHATSATRADAYSKILLTSTKLLDSWSTDDDWVELFPRIFFEGQGRQDFTPAERSRISFKVLAMIRMFEVSFIQNREGLVPGEVLEIVDSRIYATPYVKESWPLWKPEFTKDFAEFFEGHIARLIYDFAQPGATATGRSFPALGRANAAALAERRPA